MAYSRAIQRKRQSMEPQFARSFTMNENSERELEELTHLLGVENKSALVKMAIHILYAKARKDPELVGLFEDRSRFYETIKEE